MYHHHDANNCFWISFLYLMFPVTPWGYVCISWHALIPHMEQFTYWSNAPNPESCTHQNTLRMCMAKGYLYSNLRWIMDLCLCTNSVKHYSHDALSNTRRHFVQMPANHYTLATLIDLRGVEIDTMKSHGCLCILSLVNDSGLGMFLTEPLMVWWSHMNALASCHFLMTVD